MRRCLWQKDIAKGMFLDFFRVSKEDDCWAVNQGVYTSISWQEEMQVLVLDLRYNKSHFLNALDKKCVPNFVSIRDKTMLGGQQWKWLECKQKKSH
jgi:phosphodiesterase/alkaline phosphatase D-like protein